MADVNQQQDEAKSPIPQPAPVSKSTAPHASTSEDSDPDFDDLDDVLDQFSANAPVHSSSATTQTPAQPKQTVSGPDKPTGLASASTLRDVPQVPSGQKPNESEAEFIERLSKEMSKMLDTFSTDPSNANQPPEDVAKIGKELEEFTHRMEQEGIQPEDLLKALLGEEEGSKIAKLAQDERDRQEGGSSPSSSARQPQSSTSPKPSPSTSKSTSKPPSKSFEDTIRNTISRLDDSDKSATTAVQNSTKKSEEDLLADMLRALDSGPGGASGASDTDEGLSKMFMDMMQQLTHKDLLYEPMKELHTSYPSWLAANKSKLPATEYDRYCRQQAIVADITKKFEQPGFSDDDPKCKEYIWEKMQKMQDEGAPPEELVKNPFPGSELGGIPGLGGGGADQMPEGLAKELEEGCPTQ